MEITKNMKAGYQGKKDSMRDMAERLLNHPGEAAAVYYSKSCADKDQMRPYKKGGSVVKDEKELKKREAKAHKQMDHSKSSSDCVQKYAMGGVAKIRHEEATAQGLPKKFKKISLNKVL